MIECAFLAVVAALVGWLMRRKRRQRSDTVAAGESAGVPCMLKWAAQSARWRAGRLLVGHSGPLVWTPSFGKRETVLPAGLRRAEVRTPSVREALAINPGSRIVRCESSDGDILIAVMPDDLATMIAALEDDVRDV
ncbi:MULTISPECIES: hypothetical protein [unclassified Streptomyces]|uniref:hypothetical protein n=1 Tax=unclassified Streptomyces TaxID=2593676 RepID=UPI00277D4510|nr:MULTISPECIES: hypothetical protein [unclassified Streptomyces]MDQ0785273.1 hypothetical protein [Streptomyces sp. B3I8]